MVSGRKSCNNCLLDALAYIRNTSEAPGEATESAITSFKLGLHSLQRFSLLSHMKLFVYGLPQDSPVPSRPEHKAKYLSTAQ